MNVPSYVADISYKIFQVPPSRLPGVLWNYYAEYLWHYQPNSWVARIASTSRILAIFVSLPIVILALLDIVSYGIARTLGVIDDVQASTSDNPALHQNVATPSAHNLSSPQSRPDSRYSGSDHKVGSGSSFQDESLSGLAQSFTSAPDSLNYLNVSEPHAFYVSEDNNLKLSGVGVFSPATSRPPSPSNGRKGFIGGRGNEQELNEGLRQRVGQDVNNDAAR